jgi:hypothetical protein
MTSRPKFAPWVIIVAAVAGAALVFAATAGATVTLALIVTKQVLA